MSEPQVITLLRYGAQINWADPEVKQLVKLARSGVPLATKDGRAFTPPIAVNYDTQTVGVGRDSDE